MRLFSCIFADFVDFLKIEFNYICCLDFRKGRYLSFANLA